jgi:hypothetical protein
MFVRMVTVFDGKKKILEGKVNGMRQRERERERERNRRKRGRI